MELESGNLHRYCGPQSELMANLAVSKNMHKHDMHDG